VARDSHGSYGSTLLPGVTYPIPEPCDGGEEYGYDDFSIELVEEPEATWPQEEFGTIKAPWNRTRWDNPVGMLEDMKNMNLNYILMDEAQSKLYLHLYDNQSNHVGKNYISNRTEIEIPDAFYVEFNHTTVITVPLNLTDFRLVVDATYAHGDNEEYQITIKTVIDGEFVDEEILLDTISRGDQNDYYPDIDEETGEIYIIPEFSAPMALPMLMVLTLVTVLVFRKRLIMKI